jgi:hypothetical protein
LAKGDDVEDAEAQKRADNCHDGNDDSHFLGIIGKVTGVQGEDVDEPRGVLGDAIDDVLSKVRMGHKQFAQDGQAGKIADEDLCVLGLQRRSAADEAVDAVDEGSLRGVGCSDEGKDKADGYELEPRAPATMKRGEPGVVPDVFVAPLHGISVAVENTARF